MKLFSKKKSIPNDPVKAYFEAKIKEYEEGFKERLRWAHDEEVKANRMRELLDRHLGNPRLEDFRVK